MKKLEQCIRQLKNPQPAWLEILPAADRQNDGGLQVKVLC
jgi:hypothetical protein